MQTAGAHWKAHLKMETALFFCFKGSEEPDPHIPTFNYIVQRGKVMINALYES